MSLFNETVARAARAEKALDECQKRCADLEVALKAARADKMKATEWRGRSAMDYPELPGRRVSGNHNELNNLSDDDVERLFRKHEQETKVTVRSRLLAPFKSACALLRRR